MLKTSLLIAGAIALAGMTSARAADAPNLSVTIYNNDLALVQDVRSIDPAKGRQVLEFKDVSAAIKPETVSLTASGIDIVEQNFDYDLLTPSKLMEKAVGHEVKIVRTNPGTGQQTTETATVLSVNDGVVLKIGDRIEVLRDDDVPTRVIFDKVPDNLRAKPTLSVTVDANAAGPRLATLSYLTSGLSWKADYVALFDERAGRLDLQGWITLENHSGTPFTDADTQLVAGTVTMGTGQRQPVYQPRRGVVAGGAEPRTGPGRALGDYYVYALPERTTIADNQTKQVSFLDANGVAARKVYQYYAGAFVSADNPASAAVVIDFTNATTSGLGAGLPAGTIRVYQRDARGEPKFVGENAIDHTPQGSELAVKIGDAFDVTVQPTLVSATAVSKSRTRYAMSYLVRNAKAEPVTVELRQGGVWGRNTVLEQSSLPGHAIDAFTEGWSIPVPPGGQTVLTFDIATGD